MKRFWKDVTVDAERGVRLDDRPVRTPGRAPLMLPTAALAEAVAEEWRSVDGDIDPRAMPLTGLANAAIDRVTPDSAAFAAGLALLRVRGLARWSTSTPSTALQWMQLWLMQRALLSPSTMPTMVSMFTCKTRLPHFGHSPWIAMLPPASPCRAG